MVITYIKKKIMETDTIFLSVLNSKEKPLCIEYTEVGFLKDLGSKREHVVFEK
jgi:hypothetical protein